MKTTHKETVAAHPVSTVTIDASLTHRDLSIGQAIERAVADFDQALAGAIGGGDGFAPAEDRHSRPRPGRTEIHRSSSPSDLGKGGEHSDPLADLAAAVAGARGRLTAMDSTQHDPTQKGDLHDDWMHQTRPADLLTHNNGSIPSNTSSGSGSNGPGAARHRTAREAGIEWLGRQVRRRDRPRLPPSPAARRTSAGQLRAQPGGKHDRRRNGRWWRQEGREHR